MFGNDDDKKQPADSTSIIQAAMPDPISSGSLDSTTVSNPVFGVPASGAPVITPSTPDPGNSEPESTPFSTPSTPSEPVGSSDANDTSTSSDSASSSDSSAPADDLLDLKQQALQHLSPLVSHLDQTPEEQFRTTMMMIQASDDQSLIKTAFEAAQKITDDKARAQALLDVINEINYFTQHTSQQ